MVHPAAIVDVIVVGAGLSGLRAATEIHAAGLSYVVLEAENRVGGKTLSVVPDVNKTARVDLGAAWINDSNQSEMYKLAQDFNFELIVQRTQGNTISQTAVSNYSLGSTPTEEETKQISTFFTTMTEYIDRSNLEAPWLGPDAKELDSVTALQFVRERFRNQVAEAAIGELSRSLLGVEADELSALYLVDYIKSGTGLQNISSDSKNGAQYLRNRQGNQMFSVHLAGKLNTGSVQLSSPVTSIQQSSAGCTVQTKTGKQYHSKKVIVSVPTTLYPLIQFKPELPLAKQELAKNKLGYYAKTVLIFDRPWWRDANLTGIMTSSTGPIVFTRDTAVPEVGLYSITCFHVGNPGRKWSVLSAKDRKEAVLKQFNSAFDAAAVEIPKPIQIIEKLWPTEHYFQGVPSPVMVPGVLTGAGKHLRDPFQNIHFVGTETALVWKGYMEGAVRSGERGGKEVIKTLLSSCINKKV